MGNSNSNLTPYIFSALRTNTENAISFLDLKHSVQEMLVRDNKHVYTNLPQSIEDAVMSGETGGVYSVNGTMITCPVKKDEQQSSTRSATDTVPTPMEEDEVTTRSKGRGNDSACPLYSSIPTSPTSHSIPHMIKYKRPRKPTTTKQRNSPQKNSRANFSGTAGVNQRCRTAPPNRITKRRRR